MKIFKRSMFYLLAATTVLSMLLPLSVSAREKHKYQHPVTVEMFAPERNHRVGIGGRGWFVDLEIEYQVPLAQSGFTLNALNEPGFQLTGPAAHSNIPPMPGTFSAGQDERIPGLIVLLSTTSIGAGSCQNLANLFNLTGVTDLSRDETELWDTWIVGAPLFGVDTESRVYVAVADDLNNDGIYNDAPNVVPDANADGKCDHRDLKQLGLASNIESTRFYINGEISLDGVPVVE
ncbi:hypothetical protein [Kaarinaea lacus]